MAFIHRFLRLWPCLILIVFFYWKISPYLGEGPVWFLRKTFVDNCTTDKGGWWQRILFVSNLTESDGA